MGHLKVMFNPGTVALIGATEKRGAVGRTILENLLRSKERRIFPVNPLRGKVLDVESYPSITSVPEHVNLAVVATPARSVPEVEGVGNARKFISAARGVARRKPILILKPGRFAESARAAHSHTGAMAGDDAVYEAAFRRTGIVRVREILSERRKVLDDLAHLLSQEEMVQGETLRKMLGRTPAESLPVPQVL